MGAWGLIISPLLGLIGGALQKWMELKERKIEAEERQKDREHDLAVIQVEADNAERQLKIQQETAKVIADGEAFTASIKSDRQMLPDGAKLSSGQKWFAVIVDGFCRLIRPSSTVYYQLAMAGVFVWCVKVLAASGESALDAQTAREMVKEIIYATIFLAEMCVGWWFGVSPVRKR